MFEFYLFEPLYIFKKNHNYLKWLWYYWDLNKSSKNFNCNKINWGSAYN